MISIFLLSTSFSSAQEATIITDKEDYPPGSNVLITGSGFTPGESVRLQVLHEPAGLDNSTGPEHQPWIVVADAAGNVSSNWHIPLEGDELGATLKLSANGLSSGFYAEYIFTDGNPPVPYLMSSGNYLEQFGDIANWVNNFVSGIGAGPWGSVLSNATGSIPDGIRITTATNTFVTSTTGGVQKGTGNIQLLSTGSTDNSSSCAIELHLDFTGRNAGNLSFDWASVANSTGDRKSSLRIYTSTNGTTWTELTSAAVLNFTNNVLTSGTVNVALPSSFNNSATARIRFYYHNGSGGTTGSRPKISLDNVGVTSTAIVAATAGIYESYAIMNFGGSDVFYDLFPNTGNPDFNGANLGTYNSSQALYLDGAQNKTFKCSFPSDVLNGKLYYRIYPTGNTPGAFSSAINLPFLSNDGATGCGGQNQTWQKADAGVNLLSGLCDGNYTIEIYTAADINTGTAIANNGGANYKATFTVKNDDRSGIYQSQLVLKINGGGDTYYDLQANTPAFDFSGSLGTFCNNGSLVIAGAENKTFKCSPNDVLNGTLYYRVYTGSPSGAFTPVNLGFITDDGTSVCGGINQIWRSTSNTTNILSGLAPGTYTLEVYTQASYTSFNGVGLCNGTHYSSNGGANYKATFTVLAPPAFTTKPASSISFNTGASCNAVGTYNFATSGSSPITLSYTFSGATTGSGSGTGSGSTFNIGTTNVTVTASNSCSPTAVYSFDVVVSDNTQPTVITQNITVNLDASGNATITSAQINNGSNDACGIKEVSLSKTQFDCSNILPKTNDLFISEYVEGSGNIKAIEIYNGTSNSIDLATGNYVIRFYSNGAATVGTTIVLSGTIAPGDVFVLATTTSGIIGADQYSSTSFYNGDDVVTLAKNGIDIDIIGQIGVDPGTEWGSGNTSTADNTLRRKISVTAGDTNGSDAFVPSAEWEGFPTNDISGLGVHGNNVILTVTDNNNNTATGSATVTVVDITPPLVPTISDATGECSVSVSAPSTTDICSGIVTGTTSDPTTYTTQGIYNITWTFKDASGNTSTQTQKIVVKDITPPVANAASLPDVTGECSATITTAPTATDNCGGTITGTTSDPLTRTTQGTSIVTWTFDDGNGNTSTQTQKIVVKDVIPPSITCPADIVKLSDPGKCGAVVTFATPVPSDNCNGSSVMQTAGLASGSLFPLGTSTVEFTATDVNGNTTKCSFTITVTNVAPVINSVTPSTVAPIALGSSVSITTNFTDNNVVSASVNWDDGSANTTVSNPASTFTVSRTYLNPGVYSVTVTLTDACELTTSYKYDYVVVYDPNGGFVTGGGWINSPAGAYVADASLTGKANFGFVAKYKKGTTVPDGNTEFQFHAGNFNFKSSTYDAGWLVISGYKATFRGTGTVNGSGNYGFLVAAIDGQKTGGGGFDKFRIKIWDKNNNNAVVYDNQMNSADNAEATTVIAGGSIVIHEVKKSSQTFTAPILELPITNRFDVKVFGNPSTTKFTLKVESSNLNEKITLKIVDVSGRIVEVKQNVYAGQLVEFGTDYKVGSYFVEAVQGDQRKIIKLIKAARE
ncbi:MAG TPA: HYR domain-containing protein [Lacibacter sp.]|nr:HYR domain-containing protein [Lacibacter sp.]